MGKHQRLQGVIPVHGSEKKLACIWSEQNRISQLNDHAPFDKNLLHLTTTVSCPVYSEASVGQKLRIAEQALIDAQCVIMEQLSRLQAEEITLQKLLLMAAPKKHHDIDDIQEKQLPS